MDESPSSTVRTSDRMFLVHPGWRGTAPGGPPPADMVLGSWPLDALGNSGPFEPNPCYLPRDDYLPTDPVDAVLRLAADGGKVGGEIVDALRNSLVFIGCDHRDRPLIVQAPDAVPCVMVISAAVHRHRVEADRWWPVLGAALPDLMPAGVDILINPGGPDQFRLLADALRST